MLRLVARVPFTLALMAAMLVVGILTGTLTSPATEADWYEHFAYGVPSFADDRWWTTVTGTFLVTAPWGYVILLFLIPAGVGWLEFRRGTGRAAAYFAGGQVIAVIGAAILIAGFAEMGSTWAGHLVTQVDVGPSGGIFACLAAAAASLPSPWRGRALLVLTAFTLVSVLFLGSMADVEHAMAVGMVLLINAGSFQRPTVREQRFVAFVMIVTLVVVQFIASVAPTTGPFGQTYVGGTDLFDVLFDGVIAVVVATGLRRGYRVAWIVSIVLASFNVLAGALAVFFIAHPDVLDSGDYETREGLAFAAATGFLWAILLVWMVACRRAFRARLRRRLSGDRGADRPGARLDQTRAVVERTGGGVLSWMATWRDNRHYFGSDDDSVVAYQTHQGVALVLGDPIASPEASGASLREFIGAAEGAGFTVSVFGASAASVAAMPDGWRALQIAEDTILDLPGLEFTGKKWGAVRTAMNRAQREDMRFRFATLADEPRSVRAQIHAISEQWVGDKGLPEMRFTLGSLDEALDPEVRMAIAETADGTIEGFLSWLPVFAPGGVQRGWTLDLMRRRDGGTFPPVMEFLIGSSALAFRDEDAQFLSLSGAPLARSDGGEGENQIEQILDRLGGMLEPAYGFRSLHRFKQKFNPRAEPMYLLYADESDLARIGLALVRAYLPDASVPQLVRAGLTIGK